MPQSALPLPLLSLLFVATRVSAGPLNFIENYRNPTTPSPEDGPPGAQHATRDKSVLPYEICGIVGGYLFTVLIWGVLLLTVGRRMRRRALEPPRELELELQNKPTRPTIKTPSMTSPPLSARSWLKKFKKNDSGQTSPQSPVVQSPSSFDQKVIDAHRDQAQADMERLYAAVMEYDAKKHSSRVSIEEEDEPVAEAAAPSAPTERRRPSAISVARPQDTIEVAPSPVRAIYPPGQERPSTASNARDRLRAEQPAPSSPRSILSKRSQTSNATTGSKSARFNLKNLRISGPITKYPGDTDDEARRPLSPRFYAPGPPPSPPSQTNSPTSPYQDESLDQVQPLPRPAPQRSTPNNPGLTISTSSPSASSPKTASSTNQSLPLRSFASPLASPGIQTTVIDRRVDKLALGTPKTGVPFTPYSPYMPFTPVTPVTPHLTTRRDRKMEKKMEGRRGHRQVKEEMVQTPKEIFGDAY